MLRLTEECLPGIKLRWISKNYVDISKLRRAYLTKAIVAGILILLAIAFAIALYQNTDVGGTVSSI